MFDVCSHRTFCLATGPASPHTGLSLVTTASGGKPNKQLEEKWQSGSKHRCHLPPGRFVRITARCDTGSFHTGETENLRNATKNLGVYLPKRRGFGERARPGRIFPRPRGKTWDVRNSSKAETIFLSTELRNAGRVPLRPRRACSPNFGYRVYAPNLPAQFRDEQRRVRAPAVAEKPDCTRAASRS